MASTVHIREPAVPLAVCAGDRRNGLPHKLCRQCERYINFPHKYKGLLTQPAMKRPGECFNYIMKDKTCELQIKSKDLAPLCVCPVCKRCV